LCLILGEFEMLKKLLFGCVAFVIFIGQVSAAQVLNVTVNKISAAAGSPFYIGLASTTLADGGACNYNVLFLPDTATTAGKGIFAILLSAYSSGTPLSRIDFARDGSGNCTLYLVQS
jgi:hypothetical protein